jgi:hypothetical protein
MSSTPYPAAITFTELDDARFIQTIFSTTHSLHISGLYIVDDFIVGPVACICHYILMAPAFLIRHASLAASLYNTLEGLNAVADARLKDARTDPGINTENIKFEKKMYMYVRYLIKTLVPGAVLNSNTFAPKSAAEFLAEFNAFLKTNRRRAAYLVRRNSPQIHEEWHEYITFMQTEFARVKLLSHDASSTDKAIAALEKYVRFALLHNHIIGASTAHGGLTAMIDDYWALVEHLKAKKFPNDITSGFLTLVAAVQLNRNRVPLPEIPEPPADPPALQHEEPVVPPQEEEPTDGDWSDYIRRHAAAEEDEDDEPPRYWRHGDRRSRAARRAEDDLY